MKLPQFDKEHVQIPTVDIMLLGERVFSAKIEN